MNEMERTAMNAGIKTIGRHKAAQLFALCYVIGDEPFVFSQQLHDDVMTAGLMYGIHDTGTPDAEVVNLIKNYMSELFHGDAAEWVDRINTHYGTAFPYRVSPMTKGKELWQSTHT